MNLQKFGRDLSSADRWQQYGSRYAKHIDAPYHQHRLDVIKAVLPDLRGKSVLDFGAGEGALARTALSMGSSRAIAMDFDAGILEYARKSGLQEIVHGGVNDLHKIEQIDCIISANVMAYFSEEEERTFYKEAARLLAPHGHLIVSHSNELFDLFTLNSYTAAFHKKHFGCDSDALLKFQHIPKATTYNIRENPLTYPDKLRSFGFASDRTEFINFHSVPPLLDTDEHDYIEHPNGREYRDTLSFAPSEQWKLRFQCSMFVTRAARGGVSR